MCSSWHIFLSLTLCRMMNVSVFSIVSSETEIRRCFAVLVLSCGNSLDVNLGKSNLMKELTWYPSSNQVFSLDAVCVCFCRPEHAFFWNMQ